MIDVILFLLFIIASYLQWQLFAYDSNSPLVIHLTNSQWSLSSLTIQNFSYNYSDGTTISTSGLITYVNYPFLIGFSFMLFNILLMVNLLRNREAKAIKN